MKELYKGLYQINDKEEMQGTKPMGPDYRHVPMGENLVIGETLTNPFEGIDLYYEGTQTK
jgi:hypothetical protein